jgi:hypothetical protein
MLLIVRAAVPVFVRVTVCDALATPTDWLPKVRLGGLRLAWEAMPVPAKVSGCGLPGALSVIAIEAVRVPRAVGVKVTLIVQFPPAATELPHVLV